MDRRPVPGRNRRDGGSQWSPITAPLVGSVVQFGAPTLVQLTSTEASGTVSVNGGAPTNMLALPATVNVLIWGQSNARGAAVNAAKAPIAGVGYDAVWSDTVTGWPGNIEEGIGQTSLAIRASDNTHGAEFGIVAALQAAGHTVANVGKYGVGSSSLSSISSGPAWQADVAAEIYASAIAYAQAWQTAGSFTYDVVVWLQGEADASVNDQCWNYHKDLTVLANQLRTDLGNPNLIVIVANLGADLGLANENVVRDAITFWGETNPALNRVVDSDDLDPALRNGLHWTTTGYDALGAFIATRLLGTLEYTWTPAATGPTALTVVDGARTSTRNVTVAAITPATIADARYWWDGQTGIVQSAPPLVDSWTDSVGGLALSNTAAGRPDAAVGGGTVASAATEFLKEAVGIPLSTQRWLHTDASIFIVLDRDDESGTRYVFNTETSGAAQVGVALFGQGSGRFQAHVCNGSGTLHYSLICQITAFPNDAVTRTLALTFDAAGFADMYVNGGWVGRSAAVGAAANADQQYRLNAGGSTSKLTGTQREIAVHSRKLTAAEIRQLHWHANSEGYLP